MVKNCLKCDKEFKTYPCRENTAKFCSYSCRNSSKPAWNKGLHIKMNDALSSWRKNGGISWNYKGDKVGYNALHSWVRRELGQPRECVYCGDIKYIEWASVSHKAKRDLNDFMSLCRKCHAKYDDYVNKSWETRRRLYG